MSLSIPPGSDAVFHVVRNPRDPAEELVSWEVLDSRTLTVVDDHPTQGEAVADAISRNQTVANG